MLGLFGTLNLGARSLQTQRQGVEVAGQNLANVNNTAYARQRVVIQTSTTISSAIGQQGTGAAAVAIQQIRDALVDAQITREGSTAGLLEAEERILQHAQAAIGEQISAGSTSGTTGISGSAGLADDLSSLFSSFQSLSTSPTSMAERQALVARAQSLASRFRQVDGALEQLGQDLNQAMTVEVQSANQLLADVANLNEQIVRAEFDGGAANDLRDLRQQKIEALSKLVNLDAVSNPDGSVNVSISGNLLVAGKEILDTMETYTAAGGQQLVRTVAGGSPLNLTGGSIQGTISARDGAVADVRAGLSSLASLLISEVNAVHTSGFGLTGTTGEAFFTGTNASDIAVNTVLSGNPALIQASGAAGETGNNQVALALAQLADKRHPSLGGQTFSQGYNQSVTQLGQELSDVQGHVADQDVILSMLERQRDSVSGVSIDEEMTDLVRFQKAFEASARLISTVDEMLDTVINLKR